MAWTERQTEAINTRNCNLLVSAAAGSGKTAVLIERILSLIAEGTDVSELLVVTFTNAAAAEMRERLQAGLAARVNAGGAERQRFHDQRIRIGEATISTLHSFCISILQNHFQAAGIDPLFRVLDQEQSNTLLDEAMDEALSALYTQGDEDFLLLDAAYGERQIDELLRTLYTFILTQPDPWTWLDQAVQRYAPEEPLTEEDPWVRSFAESQLEKLDRAVLAIEQAMATAASPGGSQKHLESLEADREALDRLEQAAKTDGYAGLREALLGFSFGKMKPKEKGSDPKVTETTLALRKKAKDQLKKSAEEIQALPLERMERDLHAQYPLLRALQKAVRLLDELFTEKKRGRNGLSFSDLEHLALTAVQSPTVAEALREKYRYIFVDEYQDSSSIQEALLSAIHREDNQFFVGDVKQSIYRFRQAKPELFLEKYAAYSRDPHALSRKIDLNQNFRSAPVVLDAVNDVFSFVLRKDPTEIEYDAEARLYPGLPPGSPLFAPEICLEDQDGGEEDETESQRSADRLIRQARYVAARIEEMIGTSLYDAKQQKPRSTAYRDIVILMRNVSGQAYQVERVLRERGIPVFSDVGDNYFEMPEVRLMLCYLQLIDNPMQDEPLLAVLRRGFPRLSDEGLLQIRQAAKDTTFYEAAQAYREKGDALADRLNACFATLDLWRLRARYQPLSDLVDLILDESGLYLRAAALPGGRERQANLRLLVQKAAGFEDSGLGGLSAFLREVERQQYRGDTLSAKTLGEGENVVRILSMHKSKGLEFPVVFCLRLETVFSRQNTRDPLLCDDELGLGLGFRDLDLHTKHRTLAQYAILHRQKREQLAEEARLLYVAMTRAQQRLLLIGDVDWEGRQSVWRLQNPSHALRQADSMMDLVLMAILRLPDALAPDEPLTETGVPIGHFALKKRFVPPEASKAPPKAEMAWPQGDWSEHPVFEHLSWRPPESAPGEGQKTSVSAILQALPQADLPALVEAPDFLTAQQTTGAQVGSGWHALMRALPLEALAAADRAKRTEIVMHSLDALVARSQLTEAVRGGIRIARVLEFFESPLGKRLLASPEVHREWAFNLREDLWGGSFRLVQGVLDCAFREGDAWVLLDYKTDSTRDIPGLLVHYRPQVRYYAQALSNITGSPVREAYLYLIRAGEAFPVSLEDPDA